MGSIKKVFLTGATGYLGSHLLQALTAANYEVVVLKRLTSNLSRIDNFLAKIEIINIEEVDLQDYFSKNKIDIVIHTAASYGRANENITDILFPNLLLPLQLLQAAIGNKVQYFINTDTALPRKINIYALSKKQFTDWLQFYKSSINVINIELQYFYGAGDDNWKFINSIIRKFLFKEVSIDFTTAEQQRDFIYIEDTVQAYMHLVSEAPKLNGYTNVQLGSGQAVTLKEVVLQLQTLCDGVGTKLNFGAIPMRENEVMYSQASLAFLQNLGWKPLVTLTEGLKRTVQQEIYQYANSQQ